MGFLIFTATILTIGTIIRRLIMEKRTAESACLVKGGPSLLTLLTINSGSQPTVQEGLCQSRIPLLPLTMPRWCFGSSASQRARSGQQKQRSHHSSLVPAARDKRGSRCAPSPPLPSALCAWAQRIISYPRGKVSV